jgi:hypothetical protein
MRGALRYVITSATPGAASASAVSSVAIRPRPIVRAEVFCSLTEIV